MFGFQTFGYDVLVDWGKNNGVIEWDRTFIPDGWNHLTDEEKRRMLFDSEDDY